MEFEWDEAKRASNLAKHGVDFTRAVAIFERDVIEVIDTRRDYGETRVSCYGAIEDRVYFVAYALRDNKYRIISARKANAREERAYYARHPRTGQEDEGPH